MRSLRILGICKSRLMGMPISDLQTNVKRIFEQITPGKMDIGGRDRPKATRRCSLKDGRIFIKWSTVNSLVIGLEYPSSSILSNQWQFKKSIIALTLKLRCPEGYRKLGCFSRGFPCAFQLGEMYRSEYTSNSSRAHKKESRHSAEGVHEKGGSSCLRGLFGPSSSV